MSAPPGVTRFRELLSLRLGWVFDDNDTTQLDEVLRARAATNRLGLGDYLNRLAARPWDAEVAELTERLSVTETYFFRHGEQFRALREVVLPERIAARSAQRVLRLLSVACSSGEEPYSLAITAREACPGADWIVSVTGIDANQEMLRRAEKACYSAWSMRETSDVIRRRWLPQEGACWRVHDEIRAAVSFRQANVADDDRELWPDARYDVIFCRNLLMYLTTEVAGALVRRMTTALAPGGYLFLGHTDTLGQRPAGLESRQTHQTFYYRRPDRDTGPTGVPVTAPVVAVPRPEAEPGEDGFRRATALLSAERFAEALEVLTAEPPQRPQPRWSLLHGVLLAQVGRLEEATVVGRRLVEATGLYADAHQLLGLCREGELAVNDAVAEYRLAAYLDPRFALPRLRLGLLARRRGENRAAEADLRQALDLLAAEDDGRIALFGGGFGRLALTILCRTELDACRVPR